MFQGYSLQDQVCQTYPRSPATGKTYMYVPFYRDILHENINLGSTPRNLPAMTAIIDSTGDGESYVPNVDDDSRMSWIEPVTDFVTKHGFIGGLLTPGMPMSRLTRKMKTYVSKAIQSCGADFAVSKVEIHGEFLGGRVAGFVGRKKKHRPQLLWLLFSRISLDTS